MKKAILITALALSFLSFDLPYSVLCTGKRNDGSRVDLINSGGKNYIVYYDKDDCQVGNAIETSMQPANFAVWCRPLGYISHC